jgi:hypothetical protein
MRWLGELDIDGSIIIKRVSTKLLHGTDGVGIAQWYRPGLWARWSMVQVPAGAENVSLHRVQSGSGAHPPPIQRVVGAPSLGLKRPGREADHSPASSAKVKNALSYTSPPQYASMAWCTGTSLPFTFYSTEQSPGSRSAGQETGK